MEARHAPVDPLPFVPAITAVWFADAIQDRPRSFGPELHPEAAESGYVSEGLGVCHGFGIVQTNSF
jgi:hypothetical protein